MQRPSHVQIIRIERLTSSRGESFYRFHGALHGELIRDSVNIPAAHVEALGMVNAQEVAKRHLAGLASSLERQHAGR